MTTRAKIHPASAKDLAAGVVIMAALKDVHPDPDQPRQSFGENALLALADNIRERGIQSPILVRAGEKDRIVIVDGERRWRAAKIAKLPAVPVLLAAGATGEQLRLDQVSVNQLREQLKPMDLARVLRGLRDARKTVNEIAATLVKQGHHAVTPRQIDELVVLTDLPEWAQSMVNADLLETKAAGELLPLIGLKGVEKPLQKELRQAAGYRGRLELPDVRHAARNALLTAGAVNLGNVDSWSQKPLVHFAWKTRCKGCEHLQRVGVDGAFCLSRKTFEEHNQEAKDAGLLPGGKRPEKAAAKPGSKTEQKAAAAKVEQRERSLAEKARDYLHARLCVALVEEVGKRKDLQGVLVLWRAMKNPGSRGTRGAMAFDSNLGNLQAGYRSLETLAGECTPSQLVVAQLNTAIDVVNELPWRETHALARLIWGNDLHTVWNLDRQFLDLFRKSELVHLAGVHGCALPEGRRSWDAMKGDEIKDALLAQHEKLLRPAILADLYQGEIEPPYVPWGMRDEDDEDTDDGGPYFEQGDMEDAA